MKVLLLALFVAVATAVPVPDEEASGPVDVIVQGVAEGEALEIDDIVQIKLKEHVGGEVVAATNLLHPYTAVGIAEAAAAAAAEDNTVSEVIPEPVVLPSPAAPEVIPEPVVLPPPAIPAVIPEPVILPPPALPVVIPEPVVLPSPALPVVIPEPVALPYPAVPVVIPEPVVLPSPAAPEVIPEPIVLPAPAVPEVAPEPVALPEAVAPEVVPSPAAQLPNGDVYNDGVVQVTVNGPEEPSVLSTLQGWFNMVLNYFSDGVQTSHQIV